ncbi:hypothetical protein EN45_087260 [Penicillium chrysogenum]|uniref:Uncharacterized protein n=1 Tax=Penicillium chrysogenum TaxID=5076 RepID=A0A167QC55_PENCH|nr:hypothetical protein EN45_087260 [Penicillium chrysogenum]
MKINLCFFAVLAPLVLEVDAAALNGTVFPSCAVTCDNELFSDCSLGNNTTCFCASRSRPTELLDCASSSCTTKEFFTTKRLYEQECDITPLEGPPLVSGSTLLPLILASFFFVARIVAKGIGLAGGWGWDDYTIITSYYFQSLAVIYKIQISLAKISVCLFLLRIFQSRTFLYLAYTLIGINAAIGIIWALVDSFRCLPIRLAWTGWTNEEPGQCINFINSTLVNCLVNIFVDSLMIVLPVYEVTKLQLPRRKKLIVALMFIVGAVLTIIAIIRVVVFWNNRWGVNQTLGLYPLVHWSVIETQIAIMCACLPAFRALLGRVFPGLLGGSSRTYASPAVDYYHKQTGTNGNINKSVSYSVNYASRSETNSDIELVATGAKSDQ